MPQRSFSPSSDSLRTRPGPRWAAALRRLSAAGLLLAFVGSLVLLPAQSASADAQSGLPSGKAGATPVVAPALATKTLFICTLTLVPSGTGIKGACNGLNGTWYPPQINGGGTQCIYWGANGTKTIHSGSCNFGCPVGGTITIWPGAGPPSSVTVECTPAGGTPPNPNGSITQYAVTADNV